VKARDAISVVASLKGVERFSEHAVVSCETERVRGDSVVLECTSVINPIMNPNPVYSH
jgi:hypothetical protein